MNQRNLITESPTDAFPGQYEGEHILIFVRRHWMAYIGWILLLIIMLVIPAIVLGSMLNVGGIRFFHGANLIYSSLGATIYLLVTNAVFLTTWIEHYLDVAILTSERLIHISQVGLFNRHVAELSLLRVQDVSARMKGYLPTLFQYGQVIVESAGDTPNFVMPFAPRPHVVANTILTLHDRLTHAQVSRAATDDIGDDELPTPRTPLQSVSADLRSEMPSTAPPSDYKHGHFQQDLMSEERERRRGEAVASVEQSKAPEVAPPPLQSPNRLRPVSPQKPATKGEEDLEEGTTISLH